MSRIGRAPIEIPAGVTVDIDENNKVTVKGSKGTLSRQIRPEMKITVEGNVLTVTRPSDNRLHRSLHGLSRTLINNMVVGVTTGYTKNLEINGVGYRAAKQGKNLTLALGFSHPVVVEPPEGISFEVPSPTAIQVSGTEQLPRKFAVSESLNRTKAKALNTQVNIFAAKKVKLELKARSNLEKLFELISNFLGFRFSISNFYGRSEIFCSKSQIKINCVKNVMLESAIKFTELLNVLV